MANKLNFIDVFAGAGGLSCGLEMAGMNCILGVDHDKDAMATFALNHKNAQTYCGDITGLSKKQLCDLLAKNEVHAVVGGPPCQGFSTAGKGNPLDDRNSLFLQFLKIVKVTNPYFVVIENVTGLLAKKNEQTLQAILKLFSNLGYRLDFKVLSAQHYGVPEKRRRTIIIGTRINLAAQFPPHDHDTEVKQQFIPAVTVGEALADLPAPSKEELKSAQVNNQLDLQRIKRIPEGQGIRYEKDENAYFTPRLKMGVDWDNLRENRFRQTRYQRLHNARPAPTIMTNRRAYYHPTKDRHLTAREAAKLQSFPNDFEFIGSNTSKWRQIGNAVPPLLGRAIGKALIKMHKAAKKEASTKEENVPQSSQSFSKEIKDSRKNAFVYKSSRDAEA